MSQEKIEVIILTDDGIMIQDIKLMVRSDYKPILRMPTVEEITKVADGCSKTLQNMADDKKKEEEEYKLMDVMFQAMVEKHGRDNVTINEDGSLTVIDNGESHKIWVE